MLTLYSLSHRRVPALIALVAILMLFVAPEISRTLEHQRMSVAINDADKGTDVAPGGMGDMPMAGMAMGAHREHEAINAHAVQDTRSVLFATSAADAQAQNAPFHVMAGGAGVLQDFACGYCQLLAYFPFLTVIFIPFIWLMLRLSCAPPGNIIPVYPITFFPGLAQPRAPPVD